MDNNKYYLMDVKDVFVDLYFDFIKMMKVIIFSCNIIILLYMILNLIIFNQFSINI